MVIIVDGNVFPQHGMSAYGNLPMRANHDPPTDEYLVADNQFTTGGHREFHEPAVMWT